MHRYLVHTMRNDTFDVAVLPAHYAHLEQLRATGRLELAGPFTDRTGEAYLLKAGSLAEAEHWAFTDPLYLTKSSTFSVHEWATK